LRPRRTGTVDRSDSGIRATAVLINPTWRPTLSRPVGNDNNSNRTAGSSSDRNNSNQFSAFSILNEFREYQREPMQTSNTTSNSRISHMMDRILSRYRSSHSSNGN
jgi:hypothetical protein